MIFPFSDVTRSKKPFCKAGQNHSKDRFFSHAQKSANINWKFPSQWNKNSRVFYRTGRNRWRVPEDFTELTSLFDEVCKSLKCPWNFKDLHSSHVSLQQLGLLLLAWNYTSRVLSFAQIFVSNALWWLCFLQKALGDGTAPPWMLWMRETVEEIQT